MSLTVQQLLADAKRLSGRLREHDQSADQLISRAQEVLKEVDAMKQYQEDVENLNEVAHNRPRAQLVLGIQQENRHIRALQHENKELRAALEEHQNALELIMSKYRQHVTRLINSTRIDKNLVNNHKTKMLQQRTDQVCEMAAVMKESVKLDEAANSHQQELLSRLITENKGLRELLDISRKNGSIPRGRGLVKPSQNKEVQTEQDPDPVTVVTLPCPAPSLTATTTTPMRPALPEPALTHIESSPEPADIENHVQGRDHSSASESDETSDDDSIKFDTIKLSSRRKTIIHNTQVIDKEKIVDVVNHVDAEEDVKDLVNHVNDHLIDMVNNHVEERITAPKCVAKNPEVENTMEKQVEIVQENCVEENNAEEDIVGEKAVQQKIVVESSVDGIEVSNEEADVNHKHSVDKNDNKENIHIATVESVVKS